MKTNFSTTSVSIPILARMLSADPFVANSAHAQDYNRYSYVRNNPLKYTDPSGYLVSGGYGYYDNKLSSKIGQINRDREWWADHWDNVYHRGVYGIGGGFAGTNTFYAIGGNLYTIGGTGSTVSTNVADNMNGNRVFYRNGNLGFYAQISGSIGIMLSDKKTIGFTISAIVCKWVPVGSSKPQWQDEGTIMFDRYGGKTDVYYHNHSSRGSFAAPPLGVYIHEDYKNKRYYTTQLLQHEHAHTLVAKQKGLLYHYLKVAPISLMSTQVWNRHEFTSVEIEANQYGAAYWGFDSWDFSINPIYKPIGQISQDGRTTLNLFLWQLYFKIVY